MVTSARSLPTFAVKDVEAARSFYADTLGLPLTPMAEAGFVLNLASGADVFVYGKPDHTPAGFTVLHLIVDDVDETVAELTARGVVLERYEGFDQDDAGIARGFMEGGDGAWFRDPSGNVVGLMDGATMRDAFDGMRR